MSQTSCFCLFFSILSVHESGQHVQTGLWFFLSHTIISILSEQHTLAKPYCFIMESGKYVSLWKETKRLRITGYDVTRKKQALLSMNVTFKPQKRGGPGPISPIHHQTAIHLCQYLTHKGGSRSLAQSWEVFRDHRVCFPAQSYSFVSKDSLLCFQGFNRDLFSVRHIGIMQALTYCSPCFNSHSVVAVVMLLRACTMPIMPDREKIIIALIAPVTQTIINSEEMPRLLEGRTCFWCLALRNVPSSKTAYLWPQWWELTTVQSRICRDKSHRWRQVSRERGNTGVLRGGEGRVNEWGCPEQATDSTCRLEVKNI